MYLPSTMLRAAVSTESTVPKLTHAQDARTCPIGMYGTAMGRRTQRVDADRSGAPHQEHYATL